MNIAVLGDGGWGTTLALLLNQKGFKVAIWGAFPQYVRYLKTKRINSKFLPGIRIPQGIEISHDLKHIIAGKDLSRPFAIPQKCFS